LIAVATGIPFICHMAEQRGDPIRIDAYRAEWETSFTKQADVLEPPIARVWTEADFAANT
jgi:hypothetical protein